MLALILSNPRGSSLTISQAAVTGLGFSLGTLPLPLTLAAGQSRTFSVAYTPPSASTGIGSLSLSWAPVLRREKHRASNTVTKIFLTGTGVSLVTAPTVAGQLIASPGNLGFGNVQVGNSQPLQETVTNSGGSSVTITQAPVSGAGTAQLTVNPSSLNFGSVPAGSSAMLALILSNSGGSSLTISQAAVTGSGFSLGTLPLPLTLAAGQSRTFSVTYTPPSAGTGIGSLSLSWAPVLRREKHRASNSTVTKVFLAGTGVSLATAPTVAGQLIASPGNLGFGNVQIGNSQALQETVTNSGGSSVTITQAPVTGAGFSMSGMNLPMTLTPGQSATFNVTFAPQSGASASGKVSIASNASNATLTIPFSGTGVTPGSLTASPASLGFGSVQMGNSQPLQETVTNSGGSSVTITQAPVTGAGFSMSGMNLPVTLTPGQSATFSVTFAPQSGASASGKVSIASNASNATLTIPFSGTGVTPGSLTASPASLSFGSVQMGNSQPLQETVTNSGGASVTITQAPVTGAGFSMSGMNLPMTLTPGQSATFNVTFAPQSGTSASGQVSVASNASNATLTIPFSGTGVTPGSLTASPASLGFGSIQVGNSQPLQETVTNSGGSSVTITQAPVTGAGFSMSGMNLPVTLTPGQSATFNVTFAPQSGASASGQVSIASNASNATLTIPFSGTGVSPGSLTASPASLSFGSVQMGNSQPLQETVTNSGGSSVTITQAPVTGAGFSMSGMNLPVTLTPGQSATFSVTFAPQSGASASGKVSIASNASNATLTIPFSGTGVSPGSLTASPASLSFGSVQVGTSQPLQETVTNSGGASVTITQAPVTGAGFSMSGMNLPVTIDTGPECDVQRNLRATVRRKCQRQGFRCQQRFERHPHHPLLRDRSHPRIADRKPGEPQFRQRSGRY